MLASSQSCPSARRRDRLPSEEKTITSMPSSVIVGVETHKNVHVAVAIDTLGGRLAQLEISATAAGYQQLHRWATDLRPN